MDLLKTCHQIERCREAYYNNPVDSDLSDAEFDELLKDAKAEFNLNPPSDPTEREYCAETLYGVGATPSYGAKIAHEHYMGSLKNAQSDIAVINWANRESVVYGVATPKVDGLALSIVYKKGKLSYAATRGDGKTGNVVTEHALAMGIPASIPNKSPRVEVRGEVYMPKSVFVSRPGEWANPRNAAAGAMMSKEPQDACDRGLKFIAYDYIDGHTLSEGEKREFMNLATGGKIEYIPLHFFPSKQEIQSLLQEANITRKKYDFETDGVVISAQSVDYTCVTSGCLDQKIAYKFAPDQGLTVVNGVEWQVGRTGKITPVLVVEPVPISGSTITNISLHNVGIFQKLRIAMGDEVVIHKACEIIPQLVKIKTRKNGVVFSAPNNCPACGRLLTMSENGVHLLCRNTYCHAQHASRIVHYIDRMDIKGVGPGIVEKLIESGMVEDIPDLYFLEVDRVAALPGFGRRSAEIVVNAILEKYNPELDVFLSALGIQYLGRTSSKLVAGAFITIQNIILSAFSNTYSMLSRLDGIGGKTAVGIAKGIEQNTPMIEKLISILDIKPYGLYSAIPGSKLSGKSFCLTGAFSVKKSELHAKIEAAGGEVKTGVSKGLTYLVQSDPNSASAKSNKAKALGIEILSEDDLVTMLGN
jgi:DNA ligase (NAD+)